MRGNVEEQDATSKGRMKNVHVWKVHGHYVARIHGGNEILMKGDLIGAEKRMSCSLFMHAQIIRRIKILKCLHKFEVYV